VTPLPADLLAIAQRAARAAADLVRERREHEVTVAATKSSDVDVVTEADRAAEELLRRLIVADRPGDAFLGEEGDDVAGVTGVRWIMDPIDGTVNFLYRLPQYAVCVAAEVDGVVVAGVVIDVAKAVEYTAEVRVDGVVDSRRNGQPIRVRDEVPLAHRLIGTGFNYDPAIRERQARSLVHLIPRVRDIRRLGSCALDLCLVADGRLDGYVEEGVNLWDHAAAGLIAQGAGARVELATGASGLDLLVAAPTAGYPEFSRAVAEAGYRSGSAPD
jgi:myo-inositol-1(or 4)-monophosphatase